MKDIMGIILKVVGIFLKLNYSLYIGIMLFILLIFIAVQEYNKLKRFLGIKPLLEDLTKKYFLIDTNIEIPYN